MRRYHSRVDPVAAGIGFSWGSGTLHYKGKSYPIKVDGLTVGAVGVTRANATGPSTICTGSRTSRGRTRAVGAGAAVGGGGSVASMQNQNGVVIKAKSTSQGVKLKLGVDGVTMSLKDTSFRDGLRPSTMTWERVDR